MVLLLFSQKWSTILYEIHKKTYFCSVWPPEYWACFWLQKYRKPTLTTVAGEASEKPTKVEVPFYYDYNIDALVYNYDDQDYYDPGLAVINHREGNGFLPTPVPTGAKGAVQPLGKLNNTGKDKSIGT